MNKENKKLAQQRKAMERARAEKAAKWKKLLPLFIFLAACVVIGIAVYLAQGSGREETDAQDEAGTQAAAETQAAEDARKTDSSMADSGTEADGSYARFDASALKGCYDISNDQLTYVQIQVKDYGTITAALDETIAPVSVKNFVSLAKDGFYDGLTFHRIIDGFMIQGGDPSGNGTGGSKETIKGEFESNGVKNPIVHVRGAVSMARSQDPDSASSQFFIVQSDSPHLDGNYAGFGYVTDGMEIVDQICADAEPVDGNGTIPADKQPVIESVTVLE